MLRAGSQAPVLTMCRNRTDGPSAEPIAFPSQYTVPCMLYNSNLAAMSKGQVEAFIAGILPDNLKPLWKTMNKSKEFDAHLERDLQPLLRRITDIGPDNGFRIPSGEERANAFGMEDYLLGLGLSKRALFDATGNMFRPRCWLSRIDEPVENWLDGMQEVDSVQLLGVDVVLQEHQRLCEIVVGQGGNPCRCILPDDLRGLSEPGAFDGLRRCTIPDRLTLVRRVGDARSAADSGRMDT